jgi:hypothetical protein
MAVLRGFYPSSRTELSEATLKLWFNSLQDLHPKAFGKAIYDVSKREEFFPSLAKLRKYAEQYREQANTSFNQQALPDKATPAQMRKSKIKMACIRKALELGDMRSLKDASCFRKYRDEQVGCDFDQMIGAC